MICCLDKTVFSPPLKKGWGKYILFIQVYENQRGMKLRVSKYSKYWIVFIVTLILITAWWRGIQVTYTAKDVIPENRALTDASLMTNLVPGVVQTPCSPVSFVEPFYGVQFAYQDDLNLVKGLHTEVVMTDLPHDGTPASWLAFLDAAQARGILVIPWLWPQGWTWDGKIWQIDSQARLFVQTVANHPALFAVYVLHEPYWNDCEGCGYTTATQQVLYQAIKAIADVPLYSEINGIAYWTARSPATAFADGICDYCQSSYYPFKTGGIYERDELIAHITADLAVARERAPHSKIVWTMPVFDYPPDNMRVPTADEMKDLASIVYSMDVAGAWWYPWKFNNLYNDYLFYHPELYPAVREIYEDYVLPTRDAHCLYLPIIYHRANTGLPNPVTLKLGFSMIKGAYNAKNSSDYW